MPLLPAGIVGTFAAYSRHQRFPRPGPILVRFGEPIDLPEAWRGHAAREHLDEATTLLKERVRDLSGA